MDDNLYVTRAAGIYMFIKLPLNIWLVVGPPLWKIWVRQLGWWNEPKMNGKMPKFMATSYHQPDMISTIHDWYISPALDLCIAKRDAKGPSGPLHAARSTKLPELPGWFTRSFHRDFGTTWDFWMTIWAKNTHTMYCGKFLATERKWSNFWFHQRHEESLFFRLHKTLDINVHVYKWSWSSTKYIIHGLTHTQGVSDFQRLSIRLQPKYWPNLCLPSPVPEKTQGKTIETWVARKSIYLSSV